MPTDTNKSKTEQTPSSGSSVQRLVLPLPGFTPGPWTIGDENNQHIEICIGDAVANLDRQDRYGMHMVFSREEMRANGRLIAVAPRMLEALQIAKTEFEARDGAGTCPVEIEELLEELSQHNA